MLNSVIVIFSLLVFLASLVFYWQSLKLSLGLKEREKKMKRQVYELAILKELGDRIGYSLNVQKIIDIITGSLNQFIEYSAVSYMLLEPEKILFKVHLETSVSRRFVDEIKDRMLKSLSALLDKKIEAHQVEETLSGSILVDEVTEPVSSFFNIPLVISDKLVGILTVAHIQSGLYKEEEMTILYKLTKQASQAVTRLHDVVETEQRKLNAMVESMNEGVVMTDNDYRVLVVNPAAKKAIGLEDKTEISIFDFIDKLGGKFDIRGKLEESVKLVRVLIADNVLINDRFFQIFVSPVKSHFGLTKEEILGGVVIFHDITREKEVERMRDDFTSMMVHELRSPLDGIKKMSELMKIDEVRDNKEAYAENIGLIYNTSGDMLNLVNDLLDQAKLEAGKFEVHKDPTDLKKIIANRMSFYSSSADAAKIKVVSQFSTDFPEKVNLDPLRISQVLNNLLSNALKFTKLGGTVTIQGLLHKKDQDVMTEAKAAGIEWFLSHNDKNFSSISDSVIIAVTDTGVGMSPNDLSQLFNKFKQFRASAVNGEHKGTGLGLSIVKGIVEVHQGTIGAASEEGTGSTLYFTLPIGS